MRASLTLQLHSIKLNNLRKSLCHSHITVVLQTDGCMICTKAAFNIHLACGLDHKEGQTTTERGKEEINDNDNANFVIRKQEISCT